jgi:hypothetical protein
MPKVSHKTRMPAAAANWACNRRILRNITAGNGRLLLLTSSFNTTMNLKKNEWTIWQFLIINIPTPLAQILKTSMALKDRRTYARLVVGLGTEVNRVSVCISHDSFGMGIRQGWRKSSGRVPQGVGQLRVRRVSAQHVMLLLVFSDEAASIDCSNYDGWHCIGNNGKKGLRPPVLRYSVDMYQDQPRTAGPATTNTERKSLHRCDGSRRMHFLPVWNQAPQEIKTYWGY